MKLSTLKQYKEYLWFVPLLLIALYGLTDEYLRPFVIFAFIFGCTINGLCIVIYKKLRENDY